MKKSHKSKFRKQKVVIFPPINTAIVEKVFIPTKDEIITLVIHKKYEKTR